MGRKFLWIVVLLLSSIIIYTTASYFQSKKQNSTAVSEPIKDALNTYKINLTTSIKSNGISLKETECKDSAGKFKPLKDILKDRNNYTLVYRFSEFHCASCVNSALKIFRKWEQSLGKENLMILGSYQNNRVFNRTKQTYGIQDLTVYNTLPFKIFAEELGYPYFFLLSRDGTIINIFVPDKATIDITDEYFATVNQHYFKK